MVLESNYTIVHFDLGHNHLLPMDITASQFRRGTWWRDQKGQRIFLLIGIDFLDYALGFYVDLWEYGKDQSKYIAFEVFKAQIEDGALIHVSKETIYKSYLNS